MSQIIGAGNFVSWDGGCLFISHRGENIVPGHAHYATQVAFGSTAGLRFRASDREAWTAYEGAVIASRQPHSMDSTQVPCCAVLFVEPETREGRAINQKFGAAGISAFPATSLSGKSEALFSAWLQQGTREAVVAAAHAVVQELAGGVGPVLSTDERILRATSYIRSNLGGPLTLEAVAGEACLSPSRFRHLFVEETGMALRPYILWRRFLHVWDLLATGATLSSAAHAAGFADAAHLTRTSRSMFGFPPSALEVARPLATH
ncbi:MAG TPA: AraC family transcriptional regulator [Gemmatimonadaceae bacterium]